MSGPPEQLIESSETTAEPSVDSASAREWTTSSNASAYSNSKESRISSVFGNKKNKSSYLYILTPKGIAEKTKITIRFMKQKMHEYDELQKELKKK